MWFVLSSTLATAMTGGVMFSGRIPIGSALREFFHNGYKSPFEFSDLLVRLWWSKVKAPLTFWLWHSGKHDITQTP